MQAGLPEGLVEIDKYEKAQEIGIRALKIIVRPSLSRSL